MSRLRPSTFRRESRDIFFEDFGGHHSESTFSGEAAPLMYTHNRAHFRLARSEISEARKQNIEIQKRVLNFISVSLRVLLLFQLVVASSTFVLFI